MFYVPVITGNDKNLNLVFIKQEMGVNIKGYNVLVNWLRQVLLFLKFINILTIANVSGSASTIILPLLFSS